MIKLTKELDFNFLHLYNKIVDIVIEKEIKIDNIISYVFVQELPILKDIKYIDSIIFPWNEESKVEELIKIWKDFTESKMFDFKNIRLIWDGMDIKNFMKIYEFLSHKNIAVKIITKKNLQLLETFLNESHRTMICDASYKIAEDDESILWNSSRSISSIDLRKWYYRKSELDYTVEIWNVLIKVANEIVINKLSRIYIDLNKFSCLDFNFKTTDISNKDSLECKRLINFKNNMIDFSVNIINNWKSKENKIEKCFYIFDKKIPISSDLDARFIYSYKNEKFKLKITNKPLSQIDIENLIKKIRGLGCIYFISLITEDPSSALVFLNHCEKLPLLKSIELRIDKKWDLEQSFEIREFVDRLLKQGKTIKITRSSGTAVNYISYK